MTREVKILTIDTAFAVIALVASWLLVPAWTERVGLLIGLIQPLVLALVAGPTVGQLVSLKMEVMHSTAFYYQKMTADLWKVDTDEDTPK